VSPLTTRRSPCRRHGTRGSRRPPRQGPREKPARRPWAWGAPAGSVKPSPQAPPCARLQRRETRPGGKSGATPRRGLTSACWSARRRRSPRFCTCRSGRPDMGGMETSARMLVRRPKVGDEAAHESWWRVPRRARGPCVELPSARPRSRAQGPRPARAQCDPVKADVESKHALVYGVPQK